jgi:hypothetical protein
LHFELEAPANRGRELLQAASRRAIQRSPGRVDGAFEGRGARDPRSSVGPDSRTSRVQNSAHSPNMKRLLNTLFVTTEHAYLSKDGESVLVRAD